MICSKETKDMQTHLLEHNFPPFKESCRKPQELTSFVASMIDGGECLYCSLVFCSADSVRQHMADVGHGMLNTRCFDKYEKFYVWDVQEANEGEDSEDWELLEEAAQPLANNGTQKPLTLQDI